MIKKLFSLAAAVLVCAGMWAAETVNVGTYSTQTISEDFLTSTWTFITPSSQVNAASTKDVDIIYAPSSSGKMKFSSSNGFSWLGNSNGYIYVPAGSAGTISITLKSTSDSRYLQLFVNGENAGANKRLWSKYNETPTSDGKKGPTSFAFTSADFTTIGDSTFLHFQDNNTEMKIATISVVLTSGSYANCEAPDEPLALSSDANATVYVGDVINLSTTGGNGAGISVEGTAEETLGGYAGLTWTATAGEHTFVATQVKYNGFCSQESELAFNVLEKNPVTAVTIDGSTAAYVGYKLTYTATAANATAYEWYLDDVKQGSDSAKFIYTAVKGNHTIVCKARNDFNAEDAWIASDPIALTVTKLCGELIKATHTAAKTADVTGIVGGTIDKNTQDGGKLGSNGHYFGIKLASGSFMAGDVVTCVATALSGGNTATLFSDKGTTSLGSAAFDTESKTATITLTKSADWIYLYRTDGNVCNPTMGSISVTRSCEDSNDASVTSLTVNGETVAKDAEANKFEYTVSAAYVEENVTVAFTIHPLATSDKENNTFTIPTPEAGDTNGASFKVTAEDGTQVTYTVFISKSASLSNDATLKALSVEGFTLAPAFDPAVVEYTITKAYEAALPATSKVTATANDANATVNVAYNELVENEILVQVLAEDGETAKTYSIKVLSAEAVKSLNRVLFSNGFDAFIDNTNRTVKAFYLNGTEAPTATTITAGTNCTAGTITDGKIVVTGADESVVDYAVTLEAVAANTNVVESTADAGTFDGTETWVKSGLYLGNAAGFNEGKYVLRRQLKGSDKADDQRVIAGWVRAYFFVGNASKLELANTANKKVKYAVDGGEYTESEANPLVILLNEGNHMIEVVTNQSSGDCNLSAPKLVKRTATALGNTDAAVQTVKVIRNGQLIIIRDGKEFNVLGTAVK